ncbi:hypothetical protein SMD11_5975 [Streptomyces albireticuli]|uniref:Uncharacterized protein n=1 Tax=Streptomyces albireticuli TaxID=1940 RepID=A0A1Z2LBE8_9ACTN|nr:hypothetical protein [Streptomyces albireticuli]ARZ71551.1 hypothetical protein SMD11_5975 [Streptomyces albireticuli]
MLLVPDVLGDLALQRADAAVEAGFEHRAGLQPAQHGRQPLLPRVLLLDERVTAGQTGADGRVEVPLLGRRVPRQLAGRLLEEAFAPGVLDGGPVDPREQRLDHPVVGLQLGDDVRAGHGTVPSPRA